MKLLITGGSGFIAKNLYEQLKNKYTIYNPNSKELNLLNEIDVEDYLKKNVFDVIIHTATHDAVVKTSVKNPSLVMENNLRMFFNLAKHKYRYEKLISFGSGAEFDRPNWKPKMDEQYFGVHIPTDQYGFSKYIISKYIESSYNMYNMRLFAVFGKYENWPTRFISNVCCRVIKNLPAIIHKNAYYDFLDVEDLSKLVNKFIQTPLRYSNYNICTGKSYSLYEIAQKVFKIAEKDTGIILTKQEIGNEYSGDNSRLVLELDDFEFKSIDVSIKNLYNWYVQNQHIINTNLL